MDEQQTTQPIQNIESAPSSSQQDENLYIPSSVEKKRAVMMYFLFGAMIVIAEKKTNVFEYFHLKQAMGRRMVFILFLVVSMIMLFIPVIRIIGFLFLLIVISVFVIFVKQARDGKYRLEMGGYPFAIFPSLGTWLLGLFDVKF